MLKRHQIQSATARGLLLRNLVITYFFIVFLLGALLTVCSIWVIFRMLHACPAIDRARAPTFIALVAGLLLMLVSMLGVVVVKGGNSHHRIRIYSSTLTIAWFLDLTAAILCGVNRQDVVLTSRWSTAFLDQVLLYPTNPSSRSCIDSVQNTFHCCGGKNFTEWTKINIPPPAHNPNSSFPDSCRCSDTEATCQTVTTAESTDRIYSYPCLPKVQQSLQTHLMIILVITSITSVIQALLTLVLVCIVNRVQSSSVVGSYIVQHVPSASSAQRINEISTGSLTSVQTPSVPPASGDHQVTNTNQNQNHGAPESESKQQQ